MAIAGGGRRGAPALRNFHIKSRSKYRPCLLAAVYDMNEREAADAEPILAAPNFNLEEILQPHQAQNKVHNTFLAVVYDMNGREAADAEPILAAVGDIEQYIFCSSAGVYLKSDQMPHIETDATDPKSRHKVRSFTWQIQGTCLAGRAECATLRPTPLGPRAATRCRLMFAWRLSCWQHQRKCRDLHREQQQVCDGPILSEDQLAKAAFAHSP